MGARNGSVTMKTLAAKLGVSVMTISNAYNKPDRLSAELREQILATAKEIGYGGPSAAGRALRSGKTNTCGFLVGRSLAAVFSDPYTVQLLEGLGETLEEQETSILLLRYGPDDEDVVLQRAAVDAVVAGGTVDAAPSLEALRGRGVRVVGTMMSSQGDWVAIDDVEAGRQLGRHLDELGHRRIAVIYPCDLRDGYAELDEHADDRGILHGTIDGSGENYSSRRISGLQAELPRATLRLARAHDNTREAGRVASAAVLDSPDRPTAVVALSDILALGVWDSLQERGLAPGRDVSLAGFDDVPDTGFLGITTVHQSIAEKGRIAGRLAMDPDYAQRQVVLPTELIARGSTGPAPQL